MMPAPSPSRRVVRVKIPFRQFTGYTEWRYAIQAMTGTYDTGDAIWQYVGDERGTMLTFATNADARRYSDALGRTR